MYKGFIVLTVGRAYRHSVSKGKSTASAGVSTDDKTATIHYKPITSLSGNNNALVHYKQSHGYDQISYALSNIHGLYGCGCNLLDVTSLYSLNPGMLPGRFSYKRPGYEANLLLVAVCYGSYLR